MDRKLASVQRIVKIDPIPDAQNIEKATVLGWEVVINKKDNFQVGELIVYFEVDTIVPETPEFEFLRSRKFRIKTAKFKKQTSQGLVMPLSILPKGKYSEGDDLTAKLNARKYDPQGDLERKIAEQQIQNSNNKIKKFLMQYPWWRKLFLKPKRGGFPKFIKKTDEDRIQLFPDICNQEKDTIFQVTEKLDGQSGTYFLVRKPKYSFLGLKFGSEYEFGVCSRNLHLPKEDSSSYWTVAKQFHIKDTLKRLIMDAQFIVLQGEIIGGSIQGNKYKISGYDFYAFNLLVDKYTYDNILMAELLNKEGIKTVPLLESEFKLKSSIPEMVDFAKGKSTLTNVLREGIVCRNYSKNLSFKVINPDFLLKFDE